MYLTELIQQSWSALRRNRMRSVLTMLGISWGVVSLVLLLAFGEGLGSGIVAAQGSLGNNVLAVHMRGGDIFFEGGSHRAYIQPPVAYYLRAVDFAVSRLGIDFVHLVFEDRTNPAVDAVEQALSARGIAYATQSASLIEDMASLVSAHHIVAGHGTFCEAAALLSPCVESYFAFRSISSQTQIPAWSQAQFEATLRAKGVRTVRIDDPAGDFIAPGTWINSEEQRQQILNFPRSSLRLMIRMPPEPAMAVSGVRNLKNKIN